MSPRRWVPGLARSSFARLIILAIGVRVLLLPLSHNWDTQTWVNVLAQLADQANPLVAIQAPYESLREQTLLTQAAGRHSDFFEYWAYPPLMLYIYWPLAHLYTTLGGVLAVWFPVQPTMIAPAFPLSLLAITRLPSLVADIATLFIMRALGVSLAGLRWYAFNLFVLLVGIWTFDPVMVACLLLGLVLAERGHWAASGAALAVGAAAKYVPLVVLPALVIAALDSSGSTRRRVLAAASAIGATLASLALLIGPVADSVVYVLQLQNQRFGTGLTVDQIWIAVSAQYPARDWQAPWQAYAFSQVGDLLLPLGLLVATFAIAYWRVPLHLGFLVLVLAFLGTSKVVNEPYVLAPVALATVALERRWSFSMWAGRHLLWGLAFAYAMLNTPAWAFALSTFEQVFPAAQRLVPLWLDAFRDFRATPEATLPYAVLAVGFDIAVGIAVWSALRDRPAPAVSRNA